MAPPATTGTRDDPGGRGNRRRPMIITIPDRQPRGSRLTVGEVDDLRRLSARIDCGADALDGPSNWRRDGDHLWVSIRALRSQCGEKDQDWHGRFDAMIDFATRHGWVDDHGHVRAHIDQDPAPVDSAGGGPVGAAVDEEMADLADLSVDHRDIRDMFALVPTGVLAMAAWSGDRPAGMAVSSFATVSIDPPLLSAHIRAESSTWPELASASTIGVSVLAADQHSVARRLSASDTAGRFHGTPYTVTPSGAVLLGGAVLWLETELADSVTAGDHLIAVLRIRRSAHSDRAPLLFHRSSFCELAAPS
ncbi:hypothetical protein GDN83_17670 [Gordonia jinghuaiqii]|uniref:Flavin reductase n=1 Tax=Gordonia jinghuaiqii TaxID=2758710 RepID=A0A7D7LQA7_9ACTN|nr:flavin reductase family protein [Gordonia jinghuaiqii]MCR5979541.1 hypothetical protein [Gordonia jinghuaiqii]QMT00665.1 flavin reductase [Gordonia jinghuaiqii]